MLYKITKLKCKVEAKKEELLDLEQHLDGLQEQVRIEKELALSAQAIAQDAENQLSLAQAKVDSLSDRLDKQEADWKS